MEKGIKVLLWIFLPLISFFLLIFIIGIIVSVNAPEKPKSELSIEAETEPAVIPSIEPLECPEKGTFDSDYSYYIKLCMFGKKDSQLNQDQCEKLADKLDYYGDIDSAISNQLCKKCGQCTEEQLKEINESNGVVE